ncbi:acyl-CoA reductase [Dissulfurirhabdus thermomarina]|nr:acyl-CoA reductase [Dissulfurirhabdus thermomarina]
MKAFHIPGFDGELTHADAGGTRLLFPVLTPDAVRAAVDRVMEAGARHLAGYTTDDLAAVFGRVAETWIRPSPERTALAEAVADVTGLSPAVVERSIEVEQGNSGAGDILAALDRDLGDHRVLDGFRPDPRLRGRARAFGPPLVAAVLTANVPGLSYLPAVRSLMVKAPLAAKLASGEPLFGPAWAASLARVEPPLAECLALFAWKGGAPDLEAALFDKAPVVMLYGGPRALAELRARVGPGKKVLEHGHKVGVVLVGREALSGRPAADVLARAVALDTAMFDQRACIAPQLVFAERGGGVSTEAFAELVAERLADLEAELPPSRPSLDTAATLAQERGLAAFEAAQGEAGVFTRGTATVVHLGAAAFEPVLPCRFLRVCAVDDLLDAVALLGQNSPYLQNAGVAVGADRLPGLAEALARAGVSRICAPGRMHRPSMRWRHDGLASFMELVRWADIEMMIEEAP